MGRVMTTAWGVKFFRIKIFNKENFRGKAGKTGSKRSEDRKLQGNCRWRKRLKKE